MTSAPIAPFLIGGLVAWGIYRRVRRNIGRQPLRPRRIAISIVIFSVVSVLFIFGSLQNLHLLLGIVVGLLCGVLLGFVGLRLTKFETTNQGHFYTPNTHIGVALSALFIGRILYRFWVLRDSVNATGHPPPFQSPLTFFIFGLIAGYYIVYYIGLFVHTHDKKPAA
jgi:membrane protein CcdC involved in cytochrome C biogenesis